MAVDHGLPRRAPMRDAERALPGAFELQQIVAGTGGVQRAKQKPGLDWREPVNIGHFTRLEHAIQLWLTETGERKIQRCRPPGARLERMRRERLERADHLAKPGCDRGRLVAVGAIGPREMQAAVEQVRADFQRICRLVRRAAGGSDTFARYPDSGAAGGMVPDAKVIHAGHRARRARQRLGQAGIRQIAQHTVAETEPGHRAHLFLGRAEHRGRRAIGWRRQAQRKESREPTHSPGDIERQIVSPPMMLDVDHHRLVPGPPG